MTNAKKSNVIKRSVSFEPDVIEAMQRIADENYGGNLSAAIEDAILDRIESSRGPLSRVFAFNAEVRSLMRKLGLKFKHEDNAVDYLVPDLSVGIECKVKYTPGKAETATVAALALSVGQRLCNEILIVGSETMELGDRAQWERVARDFHLCPVKFIGASELEAELRKRMGKVKKG